ncbi:peptidylprolyl isomerase [Dyella acidisoli]|uniref:Peptidylprolyl isomerase n=1 Tax=Dyella acidisoli TaxID=1867834 RepID=A0ABQ5XHR7_9GAMM|nr:peptidylprolyl isomerase [Dyella acidisoli]
MTLRIGNTALSPQQYRDVAAALQDTSGSTSFAEDNDQLKQFAEMEVLAARARKDGLDQDHAIAAKIRVAVDNVLAHAERDHLYAAATVTNDDVKQKLDSHPNAYDEYALSHIFIAIGPTKSGGQRSEHDALLKATQIKKKLDAGADFASLAQAESDDPATAKDGGELSPMLGMFVANEFLPVISQLHSGDVSNPVRGKQGYHVILVQQRTVATFDNRHKMIEALLRDESVESTITQWMQNTPVEFNKSTLDGQAAK